MCTGVHGGVTDLISPDSPLLPTVEESGTSSQSVSSSGQRIPALCPPSEQTMGPGLTPSIRKISEWLIVVTLKFLGTPPVLEETNCQDNIYFETIWEDKKIF